MIYTNVDIRGNSILYRGLKNGKRVKASIDFKPKLYSLGNDGSGYTTMVGQPLSERQFDCIKDAREFLTEFQDVDNFEVFGNNSWALQFISEMFKGELTFDKSEFNIIGIDIETETELGGFPDPKEAAEKISLISCVNMVTSEITTFTYKPLLKNGIESSEDDTFSYGPLLKNIERSEDETRLIDEALDSSNINEFTCEKDLLLAFIDFISEPYPNIITGWHTNGFDIPYLTNRIINVLGDDIVKKLSPWGKIDTREFHITETKTQIACEWVGIAMIDYLELYKKFTYVTLEDNKLNTVALYELGKKKLENPYDTFKEHYVNDWNGFTAYNIIDARLIYDLDKKLNLIELIMTMAYDAKCNFADVFSPVKMWESIIGNYLIENGMQPPIQSNKPRAEITGAYVQQPVPDRYEWITSFDATSLYPSIIMTFNMSPETLISEVDLRDIIPVDGKDAAQWIIDKGIDTDFLLENNYAMTVNGQCFDRRKKGIFPILIEKMFSSRKKAKNEMLILEQEYENMHDVGLLSRISTLFNKQMAAKIAMNCLFGAVANEYFKYFDYRIAEGITATGQYIIRKVGSGLNDEMRKITGPKNDIVIYADTDSVYLHLNQLVEQECKKLSSKKDIVDYLDVYSNETINPIIDKYTGSLMTELNAFERKISFKREAIADVGVWVAKKRYALNVWNSEGVAYNPPKLKIMGLEIVRSSTPEIVRKTLKEAVSLILNSDNDSLMDYISDTRKKWKSYSPLEISFPRRVNGIDKYTESDGDIKKGTPVHVRGTIIYNDTVKKYGLVDKYPLIQEGDAIHFLYMRTPNKLHTHVLAFTNKFPEEFGVTSKIDYDLMFEKAFLDPLRKIVESARWKFEDTGTLEDLFG